MKTQNNLNYIIPFLFAAAFFLFLSPLSAQSIRAEFGFERGKMPLLQENRLRNDVMFSETYPTGMVAYMMPFSVEEKDAPYLRLRGGWKFSRMEAFLGLFADERKTSHQAVSVSSYRLTILGVNYLSSDQILNSNISYRLRREKEAEAGLKFTAVEDRLYFSMKMGKRFFDDAYILSPAGMLNQSILGSGTNYLIFRKPDEEDIDNKTSLKTQGNYFGMQIHYSPVEKLSLSLSHSSGKLKGNQLQKSLSSKVSFGNPTLLFGVLDQYKSTVQISFARSGFSLEYSILDNFRLVFGLESEIRTVAFPAYALLFSSNQIFAGTSTGNTFFSTLSLSDPEALSDYLIYSQKEKIKEQKIYLGMAFDHDFSK